MNPTLLFDIDGTLTAPRIPLNAEMAEALKNLRVPWHVAAGSSLDLVTPQFLQPLWDFGCRRDFDAFVSNGSAHFRCPFSRHFSIDEVSVFDFERHLGSDGFTRVLTELRAMLDSEEFALPKTITVLGAQIGNRGSMVNCVPIGRPAKASLDDDALRNREAFAAFDMSTGYRRRVIDHLNERLAKIISAGNLRIMLGGETSFDLVIEGKDKTNAVTTLNEAGCEEIVFIGDALFPGGNDAVITDFIDRWDSDAACPVRAIQVEGWEHTLAELTKNGWLDS